jgi:hypothetical protein
MRPAGVDHLVVRQPDPTFALLPTWMTEPDAATAYELVAQPRLRVESLADLRALIDALMAANKRRSATPRRLK